MKKYFVLFTLLLIAVASNAQESITDSLGCYESTSVKFCSYEEAYLKNDMVGIVKLNEFEVSYDKSGKGYTVYVRFDSNIVNAEVKYVRGSSDLLICITCVSTTEKAMKSVGIANIP